MRLIRRHATALQLYRPPDGEVIEGEVRPVERITLPKAQDDAAVVHEYRRAVRAATVESDVQVPVAQASMTALAAAICAGTLAAAFGWHIKTVAIVFGVVLVGAWLWRMRVVDALLWEVETLTGRDWTGDGVRGKPRPQAQPVLVDTYRARQEVAQLQAASTVSRERRELIEFTHRCCIQGTSEQDHGITAGGPLRDAYLAHRNRLLALGIAEWRSKTTTRAGWKLVVTYGEALRIIERHTL